MQTAQGKGNSFNVFSLMAYLAWLSLVASAMHNLFGPSLPMPVIAAGCGAQLMERIMRWNGLHVFHLAPPMRRLCLATIIAAGCAGYEIGVYVFGAVAGV